jgi:hypothetical protein
VKLEKIEETQNGVVLTVSGADILDNTPVFDIKPYLPHADCILDATGGYASQGVGHTLAVTFPTELYEKIPQEKRAGLRECLADDPRPSYSDDKERVYGMRFAGYNVRFTVDNGTLTVQSVEKEEL